MSGPRLTNKHALPEALERLLQARPYTRGDSLLSVTQLIESPRVVVLRDRHAHEREEDISDRFWALMGTNIHNILQYSAQDDIVEERLFCDIDGWRVSGQIDVQHFNGDGTVDLIDWKFVSTFSVMSPKETWERQLNVYAWLVRANKKLEINRLSVCAIMRDWSRSKARRLSDYPQSPMLMIDVPVWPHDIASDYVRRRLHFHAEARRADAWGESLPHCSYDDMWQDPPSYAVIKAGNKRATIVFTSEDAAKEEADRLSSGGARYVVQARNTVPARCSGDYCGVAKWCLQWQSHPAYTSDALDDEAGQET